MNLKTDIDQFCRNLRLKEFFYINDENSTLSHNLNSTITDEPLVKNKSTFTPKSGRNKQLDQYISFLQSTPISQPNNNTKPNMSKLQYETLKKLKSNDKIIIKQADKGGAPVTMDRDFYRLKVNGILKNRENYKEVDKTIDNNVIRKVRILATKYKEQLLSDEINYICKFEWKSSNFYGLPKVHKCMAIMKECEKNTGPCIHVPQPQDLEFRPIVAGPVCATHRLSNLLDIILKPMVYHIKSHIKDTTDFLKNLPRTAQDNSILITFDVKNLYGSIPHCLGAEAIAFWLEKHPTTIPERFSHDFIINGVKLILENNIFQFDDKFYQQCKGTAMGTKLGPTYATLVMGFLEEKLYDNIKTEKGESYMNEFINGWKRFLDDCFIIWNQQNGSPNTLLGMLNNLHPDIQFTMNYSKNSVSFLDVRVIKQQNNIITDIYHKPTDTKNYLLFSSHHPRHIKINLPYNLALRLVTIVSENVH